jgi:nucleoside-diphosphate-sugar epimerase
MKRSTISLLGCGWLGFPLAALLLQKNFNVKGSTTTPEKIPVLEKAGIFPFLLNSSEQLTGEDITAFFESDILFLSIPFKRSLPDPKLYQRQISSVLKAVEKSRIKQVIFTSATSVYPSSLADAREDSVFGADHPRSQVLLDVENMLLNNRSFTTVILRLAGLYGGERQIGKFLSGKVLSDDGSSPVNLIHRDDCLGIISRIIVENQLSGIFNLVSDQHPSQKELYTQAATRMGLPVPQFSGNKGESVKVISNMKIKQALNYQFLHPDPFKGI